ncbi:PREDICTED: cystathionine gamma-lyase-like [Priapulus caudatus]|uniref:cystathionine gamma-lyase n=1 Tax=Priapulus caudatus TaxID=37621 RepID=A0ABM1EQ34_PRICU|nr:PREDICTED: cystathionine gamma-lyase-like [Priapulus caudatus]
MSRGIFCLIGRGYKYSCVFSSGLAATTTISHLLKVGDHIICVNDVYGGTNRYFQRVAVHNGISVSFVDASTCPTNVVKAIKPNTKMVWIETPTNPTLMMVDIRETANLLKDHPGVILVVDNTFMTPYFQRPLMFGADIVLHSVSKYLNGHSDVIMGAVCLNDESLYERLVFLQNSIGAVPSPFDCYLVNRGVKTLAVRMEQHMKNGLAVAKYLEANPRVVKVMHPGLPSHPQYELGKRQCRGYSGMVSFYIKGALQEAKTFLSELKLITLAESLGGYESLAEHPGLMTHASVPEEDRVKLGISDTLIRLSIGIEDIEDLIEDVEHALVAAIPSL